MILSDSWPWVLCVGAIAIPLILALTGLAAPHRATWASVTALLLGFFLTIAFVFLPDLPARLPNIGVRVDAVTCVMLLLIGLLSVVIARYSQTYLRGDPGFSRYFRWFLLTTSAVMVIVVANNLLLLVLGWTATSLSLHQLLTFYPERTPALIAAHKKFLVSRLADVCLLICLILVHKSVGSFDFDQINQWSNANPHLSPMMDAAAIFLVLAIALRSAQIPFHGWLMQVMEAPTPVSALLHAGIVNIGGFVLIRLAPWMAHAVPAQFLLLVIGLVSTTIAALVMTTRISVKVALAWSTCAQVGFMLVECAIGYWQIALLHLVAHSLYKAHAFASAGTTVDVWRLQSFAQRRLSPLKERFVVTTIALVSLAILGVAALGYILDLSPSRSLAVATLAILLSLSTLPLFDQNAQSIAMIGILLVRCGAVVLLYIGWHEVASAMFPTFVAPTNPVGWVLVGLAFSALFALKTTLRFFPEGRLARALYPWLFAGLYLDERFTRFTFRIWPIQFQFQRPLAMPDTIQIRPTAEVRP